MVALLKDASRAVLLRTLPLLYRFFPLAIRRLWQPPLHNLAAPAPAQPRGAQPRRGPRTRAAAAAAAAGDAGDGELAADAAAAAAAAAVDPRLAELPHDSRGQPWDVVVTSRFFAYAGIGVAVAGVAPRLFDRLGW